MRNFNLVVLSVIILLISACDQVGGFSRSSIVIVDLNAVAKALGRDELMQKEVQAGEAKLKEQLTEIAGNIQQQVADEKKKLDKKKSKENDAKMQQLAVQAQQTFRNKQIEAEQKAMQLRKQLIINFREEVKMAAEPIARARGALMVKLVSDDLLWFDPVNDITGDVINSMRASTE